MLAFHVRSQRFEAGPYPPLDLCCAIPHTPQTPVPPRHTPLNTSQCQNTQSSHRVQSVHAHAPLITSPRSYWLGPPTTSISCEATNLVTRAASTHSLLMCTTNRRTHNITSQLLAGPQVYAPHPPGARVRRPGGDAPQAAAGARSSCQLRML